MNAGPRQTVRPHFVFRLRNGRSLLVVIRGILEGLHQASLERLARFASFLIALVLWSSPVSAAEPVIYGASLGPEVMYTQGIGDTWYATWADDGHLYVTSDDTTGFSGNCVGKGQRQYVFVAVSRLQGADPAHLSGETVNCLDDYNVPPDPKHDTSWKTTGITSVSGTLYLIVEQDTYEDASNQGRETARNATILKSIDHGKSWSGASRRVSPGRCFQALGSGRRLLSNMGRTEAVPPTGAILMSTPCRMKAPGTIPIRSCLGGCCAPVYPACVARIGSSTPMAAGHTTCAKRCRCCGSRTILPRRA